jgi:hypothetical protein
MEMTQLFPPMLRQRSFGQPTTQWLTERSARRPPRPKFALFLLGSSLNRRTPVKYLWIFKSLPPRAVNDD